MNLSKEVSVNTRFLRSIRIDRDDSIDALNGYIFSSTLKDMLLSFARQQSESGQGAFTWTGAYGSGKSSLALALSALLCGTQKKRMVAASKVGANFAQDLWNFLPPKKLGWKCLSVIGQRARVEQTIKQAFVDFGVDAGSDLESSDDVVEALFALSQRDPHKSGGLILFIDEMGKFLESAAQTGGDAYFFQLLGEAAARSNGRLIVVGILHQAFQEYASRLAKDVRDEWGKIQGRYLDIPLNITGDEQIELIGKAIQNERVSDSTEALSKDVVQLIRGIRPSVGAAVEGAFSAAWPINPLVTMLLGPLSRRSYGQNQRSIFSFLGSSEAMGFQDFLQNTSSSTGGTYLLSNLWDYLETNLSSAIAVSLDSHHFANAREAIMRCQSSACTALEIDILKSIALLELCQKQTGVGASKQALVLGIQHSKEQDIDKAINSLVKKSILVFRKFRDVYALYDGSDFDIEQALGSALKQGSEIDISSITDALSISTIIGKRHYRRTGALRWCDFRVLFASQIEKEILGYSAGSGAFGLIILALPDIGLQSDTNSDYSHTDVVVAHSPRSKNLVALAREKSAMERILRNDPAIHRDKIARREVRDRVEAVGSQIEREVWQLLQQAEWHVGSNDVRKLNWAGINSLVSELADRRFDKSPVLHNELLNRVRPSGSANSALKQLLHAAVLNEGLEGLGFEKFPAEKGLFVSLVSSNNLYQKNGSKWSFVAPVKTSKSNLYDLWEATKDFLKENSHRNVSVVEIYEIWRQPPFGTKDGVMPLLAVLFMLTERKTLAHYREGMFLSSVSDVDVDYLLKAPELIHLRWMDMSNAARNLLAHLANVAAELSGRPVSNLEPLEVGRALIAAYESSASWVQKTSRLSQNALKVRALFKRSNDPTKFIFDDIPDLYAGQVDLNSESGMEFVAQQVQHGLVDILEAYPLMLNAMRDQVLGELQVHSRSKQAYSELRDRAKNIRGLSGDLRLEAFINRLSDFDGSIEKMEALAGLVINKPPKNWIDNDIDRAAVELTQAAQKFNQHEMVARVKGRKDKRSSMAVVVEVAGRPTPIIGEFDVLEGDAEQVKKLIREIENLLKDLGVDFSDNIVLAALAKVSASRMVASEEKLEA